MSLLHDLSKVLGNRRFGKLDFLCFNIFFFSSIKESCWDLYYLTDLGPKLIGALGEMTKTVTLIRDRTRLSKLQEILSGLSIWGREPGLELRQQVEHKSVYVCMCACLWRKGLFKATGKSHTFSFTLLKSACAYCE